MAAVSWEREVEGIRRRREAAQQMGGAEAVTRQHEKGRLTIRERIDGLIDSGSFSETGPIAGSSETNERGELTSFAAANYVLGFGRVDGRPVAVGGEDFTQRGGSPSPAGFRKSVMAEEIAIRYRVPLIRFLEGGGGSVAGSRGKNAPISLESVNAPPRFMSFMEAMATVPVVSAAVGAVAGLPAARLVASHLSIMTRHTAQVLIGGPALVERALGEKVTKEELGGPKVHLASGVVDNVAEDEKDVFEQIRRFLSYLPTSVWESPPSVTPDDDPGRAEQALLSIIPRERRHTYKMRTLLDLVLDRGSRFEIAPGYGRTLITALARLNGHPVGVMANDPNFYAGSMTAESAQKARRFVDLADTFHLPIVSLVDEPGFMIGSASERAATIRHGTAALFSVMQSTVPWISILVRKAYGVAAAAHFGPGGTTLAWPSAETGALPLEGGVAVAFRREIAAAPDPEARRKELEDELAARRNPYARAELFTTQDLIDPRETRPALCDWVERVQPLLRQHLGKRAYTIRP
jgi:acetyl-CoA carboxylase carboxyltransferase component